MLEALITTSGPKPVKLMADGSKKTMYTTTATTTVAGDDGTYKVIIKIEGPSKAGIEEIIGTAKLGDDLTVEISPTTPE